MKSRVSVVADFTSETISYAFQINFKSVMFCTTATEHCLEFRDALHDRHKKTYGIQTRIYARIRLIIESSNRVIPLYVRYTYARASEK